MKIYELLSKKREPTKNKEQRTKNIKEIWEKTKGRRRKKRIIKRSELMIVTGGVAASMSDCRPYRG